MEKNIRRKNIKGVNMKRILLIFCLLLFATSCFGLTYEITLHSIDVTIDAAGKASVVEKFFLNFPYYYHKNQFREKSSELGTNLEAWKEFDPNIKLSVGNVGDLVPYSGSISFIENENSYLELSYELEEAVMKKTDETSRVIEYELKKKFMNNFLEKPFYVIPEKTTVRFLLPKEATIKAADIKPSAEISHEPNYKAVSWEGVKKTTTMQLKYSYWKQLSPIISISLIVKGFLEETAKEIQILLAVIVIVLFAVIYAKREKLSRKVTNYVIKHTEFAEHETEEEE